MNDHLPDPVSFGISLPNRAVLFGVPPEELLRTAEAAEATGYFDSVWVGDNFLSKPRLEAIALLSALAARTRRVKLGTICLATFPMRHVVQLAIQWASLDLLSGGRTILVVCNGGSANDGPQFARELAMMGVASSERVARVEEGIELLRALWGPDPVTYQGRFYTLEGVEALPKPAQARIPIAIAANPRRGPAPSEREREADERIMRRIARLADGWQSDSTPPQVLRQRWERIRELAAEYGRAGEVRHMSLHLMVNINDDAQAAYRESVEFLERYYGIGTVGADVIEDWLAFGPAEAVAEKIARFVEAGCTTPVLRFTSPDQIGQLERCATDVMPALQPLIGSRPRLG